MLTNCFTEYLFDIRLSVFLLKDDIAVFHLGFIEAPHRSHHVRRGAGDQKRMKMRQIMRIVLRMTGGKAVELVGWILRSATPRKQRVTSNNSVEEIPDG